MKRDGRVKVMVVQNFIKQRSEASRAVRSRGGGRAGRGLYIRKAY